jgi:hypothetical protein
MLLSLNLHKYLINEKGITISLVFSSQSLSIFRSELIAPKMNCFIAHHDTSFSQQIFNISVTEVESVLEPDGILNNFRRKSVSFIHSCFIHAENHRRTAVNLSVPCGELLIRMVKWWMYFFRSGATERPQSGSLSGYCINTKASRERLSRTN